MSLKLSPTYSSQKDRVAFHCLSCNKTYSEPPPELWCRECKSPLLIEYSDLRNWLRRLLEERSRDNGIWWLYPLLPVEKPGATLGEAWTPLLRLERLSRELGVEVYAKIESYNPTGVFTDRGAAIEAWRAFEQGKKRILVSSLGDHAVSVATYAARLELKVTAYLPSSIEYSKVYRIVGSGGRVELFEDYEDAYREGVKVAEKHSYYFSPPMSPYAIEGYRAILLEAVAQGLAPSIVMVPMGSGVLATSMLKASRELEEIGIEPPRILAATVSERSREARILGLSELAYDLLQIKPGVIKAVEKHGEIVEVSTDEAIEGLRKLMELEGLAPDMTAAVTIPGLYKLAEKGVIDRKDRVLVVFTSGPIKDPIALSIVAGSRKQKRLQTITHMLGETRLAILRILALQGSSYAYRIWRILRNEGYNVSLKTVYHHLYLLEKKGLVESHIDSSNRRRIYTLTPDGIEVLQRLKRV